MTGGRSEEKPFHKRVKVIGVLREPVLSRTMGTGLLGAGAQFLPTALHRGATKGFACSEKTTSPRCANS